MITFFLSFARIMQVFHCSFRMNIVSNIIYFIIVKIFTKIKHFFLLLYNLL